MKSMRRDHLMMRSALTVVCTGVLLLGSPAVADDDISVINEERFELGLYTGILSVEDFGSEPVAGLEFTYQLPNKWLLQASYGRAEVGQAAFESSQRQFLASDDRDFEYIALTGGFRLIDGRSFWGSDFRFRSDIHLLFGPERVSFAGSDEWGFNAGLRYRVAFAEWLTGNVDFREHFVERDFIGDSKNTMNTEFRFGVNVLF
jgi:outer membrane beta-barrel protein